MTVLLVAVALKAPREERRRSENGLRNAILIISDDRRTTIRDQTRSDSRSDSRTVDQTCVTVAAKDWVEVRTRHQWGRVGIIWRLRERDLASSRVQDLARSEKHRAEQNNDLS